MPEPLRSRNIAPAIPTAYTASRVSLRKPTRHAMLTNFLSTLTRCCTLLVTRSAGFDAAAEYDATGQRLYSVEELGKYDGGPDNTGPILLAMNGDVFDVSQLGRQFYGKEAPYSVFAARDSTRALALGSLEADDISRGGDTSDFNERQCKSLKEQHDFYRGKYPRVGRLKDPGYPPSACAGSTNLNP